MARIEGSSRYQRLMLGPSLDEIVDAEHPVRVVDAFVETLDLTALGFANVEPEATGRPGYKPSDLLKLYIYGYAHQMRSSRRLEAEAMRNIEVQWLINRLAPSFKTIADFRKDNACAVVAVCRAFVQFCRAQSLCGGTLVAIDGTKLEAVASRKKAITAKALAKEVAEIDAKIERYLAAMDEADRQEQAEAQPPKVAAALEALRQKRAMIQAQAQDLARDGLTQKVEGEDEARLMKTARHGHQVAYNAQSAVDSRHGLIVAFELTNDCNDQCQLLPMARAAKAELAVESLTVVADTGYSNGEQGAACEAEGITPVVPRQQTVNTSNDQFFPREAFSYDRASDSWTCPAGKKLERYTVSHSEQKVVYKADACGNCALKSRCTKASKRTVSRHFFEDAREIMHQRARSDKSFMQQRRELVEHPFGTIKWLMGTPRFLVRGLRKARAELALAVLGFNLKRTISLIGSDGMVAALKAHTP
jgi:transposase